MSSCRLRVRTPSFHDGNMGSNPIKNNLRAREETVELEKKIRTFLKNKLKLTLSSEKTLITHFSKQYITFLEGYLGTL